MVRVISNLSEGKLDIVAENAFQDETSVTLLVLELLHFFGKPEAVLDCRCLHPLSSCSQRAFA